MHKGGWGLQPPHNPLRLAMCANTRALFLLAFLPLLNSFYSTPRSLCHELFAVLLQRPTLRNFLLTPCQSLPSCFFLNTSCHSATPSTPLHLQVWGRTHSAAPFTHPTHARMIFTHYCPIILSLCHNSVIFLPPAFQIPSSQKCDQLFSHSPPTHLARQYTLSTPLGLLAPIPVFFCFRLPSPDFTIF